MDGPLGAREASDLTGLLRVISRQIRLGHERCDAAGYWAEHLEPGVDQEDVDAIAGLLEDVSASPWLSGEIQQWVLGWAATLQELNVPERQAPDAPRT